MKIAFHLWTLVVVETLIIIYHRENGERTNEKMVKMKEDFILR